MEASNAAKQPAAHSKKKKFAIIAAVVAVVVVAISIALPMVFGTAKNDATIYLRLGTSRAALADSLNLRLGKPMAGRVMRLLKATSSNMEKRHGAFKVKKGENALSIAYHLRSGAPSGIEFTFNNVRTKQEWAQRFGKKFMYGSSDMLRLLNDPDTCKKYGKTPENIITLFLPDTYEFYWDITPSQVLDKFKHYSDKFWNLDRTKKAQELGLTPEEVITVASIVEEETNKTDERGKVARLYLNRLAVGMPLQSDPTVKFAIGDFSIRRITLSMTRYDSPYNTYRNKGLPPGPIRIPDKKTIDAVLNAPQHNYLYMCAKSDFSGYHDFTVTYSDHLKNAHAYQQALDERGIK